MTYPFHYFIATASNKAVCLDYSQNLFMSPRGAQLQDVRTDWPTVKCKVTLWQSCSRSRNICIGNGDGGLMFCFIVYSVCYVTCAWFVLLFTELFGAGRCKGLVNFRYVKLCWGRPSWNWRVCISLSMQMA